MGYDTNSVLQAVDRKGVVAENPSVGKTYEIRRETLRRPTRYPIVPRGRGSLAVVPAIVGWLATVGREARSFGLRQRL